jgi:tetratricopeptide (TPR) repeat protein
MAAKKRPDTIAQLRQRLDRARTPERRMAVQLALGRALRESDPAEAQRLLEEVFNQTSPENHPAFHTRAATSLSSVHYAHGERGEQRRYADAALESARAANSRRGQAVAWATLGAFHTCMSEYPSADECYQQSLALARDTGYLHATKLALNNLASIAAKTGRMEQAVSLFRQRLDIDERTGDHIGRATTLYALAWALHRAGRVDESAECLYRDIELCEEHGIEGRRLAALNLLAGVFELRGDIDRERQLLGQVIAAAGETNNPGALIPALTNMGRSLIETGDASTARPYLERALAASSQSGAWETFRPDVLTATARLAGGRLNSVGHRRLG